MDRPGHRGFWNDALTSVFSGFAFGNAAATAHEASAVLTAEGLHPAVVRMTGDIGTAGAAAMLLSLAAGLTNLSTSAALAAGSLSTASGPMMTFGAIGAGLLIGTGLQAAWSWGVTGLLGATLLLVWSLSYLSQNHKPTVREYGRHIDASDVMAMLGVEFTGKFMGVVFGMAQGACFMQWRETALLCLPGLRLMLMILCLFLLLQRSIMAKNFWIALGYLPFYTAINFLSWVFPVLAVLAGFMAGVGAASRADRESEAEMELMLKSVLWVGVLSAGLLGAAFGTVAMVGLGPEASRRVSIGAAVTSLAALRLLLPACSVLGVGGSVGGLLGGTVVAGVSLVMANSSSPNNIVVLGCSLGAVLGSGAFKSLSTLSSLTILLIVGGATRFPSLEATARLPFDLFSTYLSASVEGAMLGALLLGMTTVGSAFLGGAALWTAALGKVGTLGIVGAAVVSLGVTVQDRLRTLDNPTALTEMIYGLIFIFATLSGIDLAYFLIA